MWRWRQAAQRGVKVRVLLDQLGSSSYPHYKEMLARMTKAGIEWHLMLPVKFFSSRFTRPTCATIARSSSSMAWWALSARKT